MTVSRLLSVFAVSLTLAVLSVLLGPGDVQAKIKCNSILGPGGTYVLDRDLTCPQAALQPGDTSDDTIGVVNLIGGAKLNLNGHTVSCNPRDTGPLAQKPLGIVSRNSTVKNGTVRGCWYGIIPSNSVVSGMTLVDNAIGVDLTYKYASGDNLIVGNTAMNNGVGFAMQELARQTLIDNIAQDNDLGFDAIDQSLTLIGNVALRNRVGFRIRGSVGPLLGNRAEHNGEGFWIERVGEMTGNIAKHNTGAGFVFDSYVSATGFDRIRHNVAQGNGGDGFRLRLTRAAGTLSDQYAIRNLGHGLHVVEVDSGTITITGNTAIGNRSGDLADDTECSVVLWVANRFGTAAQPCIH